jgi:hypothetical protein
LRRSTFEKNDWGNFHSLGEKAADEVQAIFAPVEGKRGVMTYLWLGQGNFLRSEIREVGGNQRGGFCEILKKVVLLPFYMGSFRRN